MMVVRPALVESVCRQRRVRIDEPRGSECAEPCGELVEGQREHAPREDGPSHPPDDAGDEQRDAERDEEHECDLDADEDEPHENQQHAEADLTVGRCV